MRNAPDDIDALVERAVEIVERPFGAQHAVLRKGDELQIEIRSDTLADVQQRIDGEKARIADVDVRADREEAASHRPVAIRERSFDQRLHGQQGFEFAP